MSGVDLHRLRTRLWLHAAAVVFVCLVGVWFVAGGDASGYGFIVVGLLSLVPVHLAAWSARRRS